MSDQDEQVEAVGSLSEPSRRALYRYVAASGTEVSRDQAAKATRLSRMLAAFHLDRLVRVGLLEATYRRLPGRTGPGAGRPAKLYRRSRQVIQVSLPERRYDLLATLLVGAVERTGDSSVRRALADAAHDLGRRLAADGKSGRATLGSRRRLTAVLQRLGFEPYAEADSLRLRNCPFDALAAEHRELVCGTNLCFMEGLLKGLGESRIEAELDPQPDRCCVAFRQLSA